MTNVPLEIRKKLTKNNKKLTKSNKNLTKITILYNTVRNNIVTKNTVILS